MIDTPTPTELRKRVLAISEELPSSYVDLVLKVNPKLDRDKVIKVKALQTTDLDITLVLEKVAASHKQFLESLTI